MSTTTTAPTPFDVVAWMRQHGIPGYAVKIHRLQRAIALALTHNHRGLAAAHQRIAVIERLIENIRREAYDRYDDWRTDPLD